MRDLKLSLLDQAKRTAKAGPPGAYYTQLAGLAVQQAEQIVALQQFVKQCEHDQVSAVPVSLLAMYAFGDEG